MHKVLDSVEYVTNNAEYISIDKEAVEYFCKHNYITRKINWLDSSPINLNSVSLENQLNFAIILNSISFCFWNFPKWRIQYKNRLYDGSWGMVAAISKAIENKIPIFDYKYLNNLDLEGFNKIVEDDDKLILKEDRLKIIHNVSSVMLKEYNSNPLNLIEDSKFDALNLQNLLLTKFDYFIDNAQYKGNTIYFNKRAQLLTSDLCYLMEVNGNKDFINVDQLTACADYKIPYILREFGILNYCNELSLLLKEKKSIKKGSAYEIEIRAFAIWAVELLKSEYQKFSLSYMSNEINDFLWLISQIKNPKYQPYHLTITTSY